MKMQTMTCSVTDTVKRVFDLERVEVVELSDCGKQVWVVMQSGYRFMAGETNCHSAVSADLLMDSFTEAFKKLGGSNA